MKKQQQKMQVAMATLVACSLLGDSVVALAQTSVEQAPVPVIEMESGTELGAQTETAINEIPVAPLVEAEAEVGADNEESASDTHAEVAKSGSAALLINEVYGGGGKAGKNGQANAPYAYDFIEIYNPTAEPIALTGLKLRYTNNSAGTIQTYTFSPGQVIAAQDYFLLRCESTVGNMGEKGHGEIFNADAFYDIPEKGIGMSDTKGSVQLLTATDEEIDAVNYGKAGNGIGEGNAITGVDHLTSVQRQNFQDTQDNASDFIVSTPTPQKAGGAIELLTVEKIGTLKQTADYVGQTVALEATITAAHVQTEAGAQERLTYVQDASGGIALHNFTMSEAAVGQKMMVTGTLEIVGGEYRIDVEQAQVLSEIISTHAPAAFTAANASKNSGWLASVSGKITAIEGNLLVIDDVLPVLINESLLKIQAVQLGDFVNVKGVLAVVDQQTRLVAAQAADVVISQNDFLPTMSVNHLTSYSTGMSDEDGGVAEIVKFNADNQKFYLINGKTQTIEIVDMSDFNAGKSTTLAKTAEIALAPLVNDESFTFGDVTSLDIHTEQQIIVAAIQEADYRQAGKVLVMDYDGNVLESFAVGVQPDMVKITADGRYILTADEAEPREGITDENWDPEGSVTIIDYQQKTTKIVKFSDSSKIAADVHIRNQAGGALTDLEPEYIALSADQTKAYVSLQENNAIATINIVDGTVESVDSLGFKDHTIAGNELDAGRDGVIQIEQLPIKGLYMPDAISTVHINGKDYLVTANEGDATEWGKKEQAFTNIAEFGEYFADKDLTLNETTFAGMTMAEAQQKFVEMKTMGNYDKLEVVTDMGDDAIYVLGGRSFAIWDAATMELVFDSGSDFEKITAQVLPDGFNWSNDDNQLDKRSSKKGPEPEGIEIGVINDRIYAFVGLERIGGIMTYDITEPETATFANYINTRDFTQKIAGDVGPEGLHFIPSSDLVSATTRAQATAKPLLLVGNEVSGTVSVLEFDVETQDLTPQLPEVGFGPAGSVTPTVTPTATPTTPTPEGDTSVTPEIEQPSEAVKPSGKLPQTGMMALELFSFGSVAALLGSLAFWRKKR